MKKRTFACGDIHGAHKALIQVLERSNFDYENDKLICLGDVSDGWGQVPECFDELLKIKDLVYVAGNHDIWLRDWFSYGVAPLIWTSQGGRATLGAYSGYKGDWKKHRELLNNALPYYEFENKLFVHGGYNWHLPIKNQLEYDLTWDRHMWVTAMMWEKQGEGGRFKDYDTIFIGHTSTSFYDKSLLPTKACNVWNVDQGGGWEGKLTLINVDSEEYFQSDLVKTLYPNEKGR